jgi:murein DD-endopeptidase MepM/ murein hydrolase activator NlpD
VAGAAVRARDARGRKEAAAVKDEDALIALGVLVLLAMENQHDESIEWGSPLLWRWPVPDLRTAIPGQAWPAQVSNEFNATTHRGVDILYRDAARGWFAPATTPIVAARAGTVYMVGKSARGWQMVIDHGKPWATYYQHMTSVSPMLVKGATVAMGQQIGIMGSDPLDAAHVRHLHFETWYKGAESAAVNPAAEMARWGRGTWTWNGDGGAK